MTEATIWKPVGKEPSTLWKSEMANANGLFLALYKHFETHERYCYVFQPDWQTSDDICHDYGNMMLTRLGKWFAYFGLVEHTTERTDNGKLQHVLKPTSAGRLICDKGGQYTFNSDVSGLGKQYPVFKQIEQTISRRYVESNVAYWRQAKWQSEWKTLYNSHLCKNAEEMKRLIMSWLAEKIASIRLKGSKRRARELEVVLADAGVTKTLSDWVK
jgi:hypothetical protein